MNYVDEFDFFDKFHQGHESHKYLINQSPSRREI